MEKLETPPAASAYCAKEDEIDLFELWNQLVEEKATIFSIFFISLALAATYVLLAKPQYKASAILQVQQIQLSNKDCKANNSEPYLSIEPAKKTVALLANIVPASISSNSKGRGRGYGYISISSTGSNKQQIQKNVQTTAQIIKNRHLFIFSKLKPLGYIEILPTQVIGKINVSDKPVKPKKALILAVAGITGLMLGIFIALIRGAYKRRRLEEAAA